VKLYNAGKSAIERIDFICSSSLEHRKLLVSDQHYYYDYDSNDNGE